MAARKKVRAPKRERTGEYVGFRSPERLKKRLEAAAEESGRSLSSEVQFRLEASFRDESDLTAALRVAYGDRVAGLVLLIGQAFNDTGISCVPESANLVARKLWSENAYAFDQAVQAVDEILRRARPPGDPQIPRSTDPDQARAKAWDLLSENKGVSIAGMLSQYVGGKRSWSDTWLDKIAEMLGPLASKLTAGGATNINRGDEE